MKFKIAYILVRILKWMKVSVLLNYNIDFDECILTPKYKGCSFLLYCHGTLNKRIKGEKIK